VVSERNRDQSQAKEVFRIFVSFMSLADVAAFFQPLALSACEVCFVVHWSVLQFFLTWFLTDPIVETCRIRSSTG
jgi:hypothetical protein